MRTTDSGDALTLCARISLRPLILSFSVLNVAISAFAYADPLVTVRVLTLAAPSSSDRVSYAPGTVIQVTAGNILFVEIWASTSVPNGLAALYADLAYDPEHLEVVRVEHSELFSVFPRAFVDAEMGRIEDIGGSHLGIQCEDRVGATPEWVRVVIVAMRAKAVGVTRLQSATSGTPVLGISLCGTRLGNLDPSSIDFGAATAIVAADHATDVERTEAELTLMPANVDLRQKANGPTITKGNFDIWNENGRRFSGSHRCVSCWDQTLLSLFGSPNHFLRGVIGTDKGRAKVDGLQSDVCPGSVESPMLGVVVKEVTFLGRITDVLRSAITPVGTGTEAAMLKYDIIGGPQSARQGTKGRRDEGTEGMANEELSMTPFEMGNRPSAIDNSGAVAGINPGGRTDVAHKGSLLFWPRVEVRWDAAGQIVSDTFLTLANDEAGDVSVQLYLVNGDAPLAGTCLPICVLQFGPACADVPGCVEEREHPGWNKSDVQVPLTANQPLYWSSWTGQPAGVSSFAVLDPGPPPGRPDDDPRNPGGRILRGFVVGWAVNADGEEICWNQLTGNALVIHYPDASAFEYNAWAFQCVSGVPQGAETDAFPGVLQMDGQEYEFAPDALTFDFYTVGSIALTLPDVMRRRFNGVNPN